MKRKRILNLIGLCIQNLNSYREENIIAGCVIFSANHTYTHAKGGENETLNMTKICKFSSSSTRIPFAGYSVIKS